MAPIITTASALFLTQTDGSTVVYPAKPSPTSEGTRARHKVLKQEADHEVQQHKYKWKIVWRNIIGFIYLHFFSIYGLYLMFTATKAATIFWTVFVVIASGIGITAGAHRLWCHRSYKAKWPLRLLLAILQTVAFENHIYEWVRDHRVHHKFTDTDADPHNAKRGFFFSHMGWLMVRKHPDVKLKGKTVDMSDLEADPIVVWQRRLYVVAMPLMCFVMPAWVPYKFWGEDPYVAWYVASVLRYTLTLHGTWLVNSAAHMWGTRPIDKDISAVEALPVSLLAFGEGWHNYHHVFPWDYKAAELGNYRSNLTTGFIDFFARIGWAYDLKTVSVEMVNKRSARTGDGTRKQRPATMSDHHDLHYDNSLWGWGDQDMPEDDVKAVRIYNKCIED